MYNLLKDKGWPIVLSITVLITIVYAFYVDYSQSPNEINGAFVSVIITSFTTLTSILAFLVVLSAKEEHWGDISEFKTFFAIGALIASVSAMLELVSRFILVVS